ncbi:PQQ-binding-like beta-propeller repeat protein [Thalassoglobus polymorphus]|uniref:Outer membrane biogenesis protein BamB n=1 Tax=Thalassoglobus polymorphus TaxID=2527994 RepID=A0A517QQD0_9PLAN|nr:PQQ-binding-like beta-propeller repeat protein [Thalassoglobus polymorphus]QDT33836.1 outer membrane biogenesis protein BamB [Thalassoglobus polymorphus]
MKFRKQCWLWSGSILFVLVCSLSFAEERSWPQWMGPKHDGISTESDWSTDWPTSGLPVAWKREIGIGFSSISIDDGRLFTMGHVDGEEYVYCMNEQNGEVLWSHKYPCQLVDNLHEGGPGSTPTIHEGLVYTVGREGQLFCFEAETGKIVWQKDLQKDLNVILPEWGFTSSAYVYKDQILLEAGRVVSYNKLTGEKKWESGQHTAGYGSAAVMKEGEQSYIVTLDCDALRVYAADTGQEIAQTPWESPFRTNSTTPIVEGNLIYISAGYNVGCALYRWTGSDLEQVYKNRGMRNHFNNSILFNGNLYGFDGNSNLGRVVQLTCMKMKTGEIAWKQRGMGCGSLMIVDGKLLALSEDGELILAKATPESFQEIARVPFLSGRCWTVPIFLNGRIYGRNATGTLVAVDVPKGKNRKTR